MELKKETEKRQHSQKRRHLVSRMRKAASWAKDAARLFAAVGDARTALEADAYSSWMSGSFLLEKQVSWELALAKLTRAKRLFSELARVSADAESQALSTQQVEDMAPALRYCQYQIERAGAVVPDAAALQALTAGGGDVAMEAVDAQLAELATESASLQAAAVTHLAWLGQQIPARGDKLRHAVAQYNDTSSQLATALAPGAPGGSAADAAPPAVLLDKAVKQLQEARAIARTAQQASTVAEGDLVYNELMALDKAVSGLLAQHGVQKAALQVLDLEARFTLGLERAAAAGLKKGKDKERKETARGEDVVRALDATCRALAGLAEVGAAGGGRAGEVLHDAAQAQATGAQALRAYYLGHAFLSSSKPVEAYALFDRAGHRAAEAAAALADARPPGAPASAASGPWLVGVPGLTDMARLQQLAQLYRAVAQAEVACLEAAQQERVQQGVASLGLADQAGSAAAAGVAASTAGRFLLDALEEWESFAGASGAGAKPPRIFPLPFRMQAIPARPIMLDTAFTHLAYPSIEHRLRRVEKKSMLSSLAGWAFGSTARK